VTGDDVSELPSLSDMVATMPHAVALGMELLEASAEGGSATLAWRDDLCTIGGAAHGGAMMAFADSLGAVVAFLNLPEGAGTSTIESKTNFFRPFTTGAATATCRLVNAGRTTVTVQTEVRNGDGKLLTMTTQTQAVLLPR
jgi:1,4-dihydroxy-2-naphthoyl-CoA hydrolase